VNVLFEVCCPGCEECSSSPMEIRRRPGIVLLRVRSRSDWVDVLSDNLAVYLYASSPVSVVSRTQVQGLRSGTGTRGTCFGTPYPQWRYRAQSFGLLTASSAG